MHWNTRHSLVLCFIAMVSANPISLFFHLLVTRKMVPITGRARSFLLVFKNKIERRGRQNKNKMLGRALDPRANGAW